MQAIATAATDGIVERKLEIVVAKEPVESRPGFAAPAGVASDAVGQQRRRDRTRGLNRLLIEASLFTAAAIEAVRPDGDEVTVDFAMLHAGEPIESLETGCNHPLIGATGSYEQQGLGQPRISIG